MRGIGTIMYKNSDCISDNQYIERIINNDKHLNTNEYLYVNGCLIKSDKRYYIIARRDNIISYFHTINVIIQETIVRNNNNKINNDDRLFFQTLRAKKIADVYEYNFIVYKFDNKYVTTSIKKQFVNINLMIDYIPDKKEEFVVNYNVFSKKIDNKHQNNNIYNFNEGKDELYFTKLLNSEEMFDREMKILLFVFNYKKYDKDRKLETINKKKTRSETLFVYEKTLKNIIGITVETIKNDTFVVPTIVIKRILNEIGTYNIYSGLCKLDISGDSTIVKQKNEENKLIKYNGIHIKSICDVISKVIKKNDIVYKIDNKIIKSNRTIELLNYKNKNIHVHIDVYISLMKINKTYLKMDILRHNKSKNIWRKDTKYNKLIAWKQVRRIKFSYTNFRNVRDCYVSFGGMIFVEPTILLVEYLALKANVVHDKSLTNPLFNTPKKDIKDKKNNVLLLIPPKNSEIDLFHEIDADNLTTWKLNKLSNEIITNISHVKDIIKKKQLSKNIKLELLGNDDTLKLSIILNVQSNEIKKYSIKNIQ